MMIDEVSSPPLMWSAMKDLESKCLLNKPMLTSPSLCHLGDIIPNKFPCPLRLQGPAFACGSQKLACSPSLSRTYTCHHAIKPCVNQNWLAHQAS
ncbi:hypothetical protein TIFTF001_034430 [Ficus carica]|uniref:Uncharacterized protein n=1 Tax=Ficus carica TaxID=3494 RepID=A0AA88E7X1_FICCA|nr:hypothetical protein TIFTF001_034430 [Ficus carica]